MYLLTTDIIAITLALVGACILIIFSVKHNRDLLRENNELRRRLVELEWNKVKGGI